MRVLYLCHRIPYPPDKGDKIRAYHQIQALASRHEVDLWTLVDDAADSVHQEALLALCRRVTVARIRPAWAKIRALPYLLSERPLTLPYFYSSELMQRVRKAVQQRSYDRIFIYCSAMGQYIDWIRDIPLITDLVDVDSNKWNQYASVSHFPFSSIYRQEARCLRQYERRICERSCCVLVSTDREAQLARQIASSAEVSVVPNGVDTDYFAATQDEPRRGAPTVVFTGDMSYFPNQEAVSFFARYVHPLVRQSVPDVRFVIVGRNPNRLVRDLQKIHGVTVTGFVPDVRTYLAAAHVAVAPFSIAAGIQNKILEAMSSGLPVVATPRAVQGLSSHVSEVVETGDTAVELANRVAVLLRDPQLRRSVGKEGRRRVATDYSWERNHKQVLELVENAPRAVARAKAGAH